MPVKTRNLVIGCSAGLAAVIAAALCCFLCLPEEGLPASGQKVIQYVEFNPTYAALDRALTEDIRAHEDGEERNWIDTLSYLGAKYGGDFSRYQAKDMDALFQALDEGETIETLTEKMEHYAYYREAYGAVLDGLVGEYREEKEQDGQTVWQDCYGLKAFFPLARNFSYEHYNDFGARRTYGYTRPHLGHDMMAATGTPVVAIESGVVEVMGWNQYGGWRIGIRSGEGRRYYYYAHLRQNRPFAQGLEEGQQVQAGQVIGYVGHTGYSTQENVNNIRIPHLHLGLELIFEESQKESDNEIWVDVYALTQLLSRHTSETVRNPETKEHTRRFAFEETVAEG